MYYEYSMMNDDEETQKHSDEQMRAVLRALCLTLLSVIKSMQSSAAPKAPECSRSKNVWLKDRKLHYANISDISNGSVELETWEPQKPTTKEIQYANVSCIPNDVIKALEALNSTQPVKETAQIVPVQTALHSAIVIQRRIFQKIK